MLSERGINVAYICSEPERLQGFDLSAQCVRHSFWDAMAGTMPPGINRGAQAADPEVIGQLAPHEPTVLQMFQRLNYTQLSIQDLRGRYFNHIAVWSSLLDQVPPDAVVFHIVPHLGFDYILLLLCRIRNIRTIMFERTYLPDRLLLIESIEQMPKPGPAASLPRSQLRSERATDHNYYDDRNRMFEDSRSRPLTKVDLFKDSIWRVLLFTMQVVRRPLKMRERYSCSMFALAPRMPTWLTYLWHDMLDAIYLYRLKYFYETHTIEPDNTAKYVYYPLQFQPERTSVPMGLSFGDQLLALKLLADSLPSGWYVYVKEHPRQFTDNPVRGRLGRSKGFYESLVEMSRGRVRLVSTKTPSGELLRHSRCVATVAGTAGWEAVRIGIPAIVFGAPWYMNCPGVSRVRSTSDCMAALQRIQAGGKPDLTEVEAFADWIRDNASFAGYIGDVYEEVSKISADENARSYSDAIAAALSRPIRHGTP